MIRCQFKLNNQPMSIFECGAGQFPAFSGQGKHINQRHSVCLPNQGPIPTGSYYIFDRQTGGLTGSFRDLFNDRRQWFALYAADEKIDDFVHCDKVKRGAFRLHPKGSLGTSQGCIVIESKTDFQFISALLRASKPVAVPGSNLMAYGVVVVN